MSNKAKQLIEKLSTKKLNEFNSAQEDLIEDIEVSIKELQGIHDFLNKKGYTVPTEVLSKARTIKVKALK